MAFPSSCLLFLVSLLLLRGDEALRLVEVKIPRHTVRFTDAVLECRYELRGEILYSVKWYKDGQEFFRYVPKDSPPAQVFELPGVAVDVYNSTESTVVLSKVDLTSSGKYRCEVSGEAPEFRTVTDHGEMTVVALPDEGPKISGGRPRYQISDYVKVNCTSGASRPPAQLDWFINGEKADSKFLRGPYTLYLGREGLQQTILGLEFRVEAKHFKDGGDMKLKCLASISTIYWKTNEESVKGDKPLIKVLSSQDTSLPNKSRADRVQAYGTCSPVLPCAPLVAVCGVLSLLSAAAGRTR